MSCRILLYSCNMFSDDRQGYIETGNENAASFQKLSETCQTPHDILRSDSSIRLRDCSITAVEQLLWTNITCDVDGIVSTVNNFAEITIPFSNISILYLKRKSLIPVYPIVKKHFRVSEFDKKGLQYLKWSSSIKLFDAHGYEFHLALLPKAEHLAWRNYSRLQIEELQFQFYETFRQNISHVILDLPQHELCRNTFKKNKISDIWKLHILPDDREFILSIFDKALERVLVPRNFKPSIICFSFGDRNSRRIELNMCNQQNAVTSVHIAATISSQILNEHILWSRVGLQGIVGNRGRMFSALSLSDSANFQSNIDGRELDISDDVRKICRYPTEVTFVQFYADTPHLNNNTIHPVYGSIVNCGLGHAKFQQSLHNRARDYIDYSKENVLKLGLVKARVEIVCYTRRDFDHVAADQYLSVEWLSSLLCQYPLVIPIRDEDYNTSSSFLYVTKAVGGYLNKRLDELLETGADIGGYISSWEAYQFETAIEMLWNGRPNAAIDETFAVNLGPGGSIPSRCATWERGFLCLEDATMCALDAHSSPPLYGVVTRNMCEIKRIRRLFTFSDLLDASDKQLGSRLILLLLEDIMQDPARIARCDRAFISDLKRDECPIWGRLSGTITIDSLCSKLKVKERFKFPYTAGRALSMVEEHGRNSEIILKAGLLCQKLNFFPNARFSDKMKNSKFYWPTNGLLKLLHEGADTSFEDEAAVLTLEVIQYMETTGLVHTSKFAAFMHDCNGAYFPWMPDILERLSDLSFERDILVKLTSYLTCIALLENHWFVEFHRLRLLYQDLNVELFEFQKLLQRKEVLSHFRLSCISRFTAYRMHESLPILMSEEPIKETNIEVEGNQPEEACETPADISDVLDAYAPDPPVIPKESIQRIPRRRAAANLIGRWSGPEIECLEIVVNMNHKSDIEAFHEYQTVCEKMVVPDRAFKAFKAKYYRMKRLT